MISIEKEEAKPLLDRKEILAAFKGDTLSFEQAKAFLSSQLKTPEENIAVKSIERRFGSTELSVFAYIYDSVQALKKFEPKIKEKTEGIKAAEERIIAQRKQEKLKKEQEKPKKEEKK